MLRRSSKSRPSVSIGWISYNGKACTPYRPRRLRLSAWSSQARSRPKRRMRRVDLRWATRCLGWRTAVGDCPTILNHTRASMCDVQSGHDNGHVWMLRGRRMGPTQRPRRCTGTGHLRNMALTLSRGLCGVHRCFHSHVDT